MLRSGTTIAISHVDRHKAKGTMMRNFLSAATLFLCATQQTYADEMPPAWAANVTDDLCQPMDLSVGTDELTGYCARGPIDQDAIAPSVMAWVAQMTEFTIENGGDVSIDVRPSDAGTWVDLWRQETQYPELRDADVLRVLLVLQDGNAEPYWAPEAFGWIFLKDGQPVSGL